MTEQSDVIFINFQTFMYSRCVKRVFYSAFVRKCTDMCKHRFGVQLLQNPPLCSSTYFSSDTFLGFFLWVLARKNKMRAKTISEKRKCRAAFISLLPSFQTSELGIGEYCPRLPSSSCRENCCLIILCKVNYFLLLVDFYVTIKKKHSHTWLTQV
jgi:hypothetical protein